MKHLMTFSVIIFLLSFLIVPTSNTTALQGGYGGDTREGGPSHLGQAEMTAVQPDDEHFVADSGEELDQYLFRSDGDGYIKFNIPITRFYFNSNDSNIDFNNLTGLLEPDSVTHVISKRILPETANLQLRVYDVDEDDTSCPEVDYIYVNGAAVPQGNFNAKLSGANNTWSTRSYQVPIRMLKFPQAVGSGGNAPQPAYNEISIQVDATRCGAAQGYSEWWAVEVDYGIIHIPSPIRPIIFAHGWTGNTTNFTEFETWMAGDGIPNAGEVFLRQGIYPIAQTANWLKYGYDTGKDGIYYRAKEFGVNKLNIFAHSKGGLVTRMALRDPNLAGYADKVITFATPHHGTTEADSTWKLAFVCGVKGYTGADYDRCVTSAMEFRTDRMINEFNYSGCVKTDAGTETYESCVPRFPLQSRPFFSFAANGDEAVKPLMRTTFPWEAFLYNEVPLPLNLRVNQTFDVPISLGWGGNDHGGILKQEKVYKCAISYLNPSVYSSSNCPSSGLLVDQNSEAITSSSLVEEFQTVMIQGGTLGAAGSQTLPATLDSGTTAVFEVYSDQPLVFTLTSPNGQAIDPLVADTDPNITYAANYDGTVWLYKYTIHGFVSGTWQNYLQAANQTRFVIFNEINSPVWLSYKTDKYTYHPGDLVTLEVALKNATLPYTGVTFVGSVTHPDQSQTSLAFYDDGTHGDTTAGNGIYTAQFTASAMNGHPLLNLSATKGNIWRVVEGSIAVSSQTAQFQYVSYDYPTDSNYNTLYDSLNLELTLNIIKSGYFEIQGTLVDGNGAPVATGYYSTWSTGTGPLSSGWHTVTLSFDGHQIYEHGTNGPYTLTNLTIMDVTDQTFQVDVQDDVYVTSSYQYLQFEHQVLSLLPYRTEYAGDYDKNGLYEYFWVYLELDVVLPDNYDVNGRLVDKNGNEIGWGSANFDTTDSGTYGVWIFFDGRDIGRHKVDGPYYLEDVSVSSTSGNTSAFFGQVYTTQPYSFKKFEGVFSYFQDVSLAHPYWEDIEILYANGLTGGCGTNPLRFCPDQIMDRAQAAVFMVRGAFGSDYVPNPATYKFQDNWSKVLYARPWAEAMRETNLTTGCKASPLLYCPLTQLNREQAVIFGLKMKYGTYYQPPPATGTVFADMTNPSYYATAWVEKAYADGLITSCGTLNGKPKFCPKTLVTRGLGAYIIVRAKNLTRP